MVHLYSNHSVTVVGRGRRETVNYNRSEESHTVESEGDLSLVVAVVHDGEAILSLHREGSDEGEKGDEAEEFDEHLGLIEKVGDRLGRVR